MKQKNGVTRALYVLVFLIMFCIGWVTADAVSEEPTTEVECYSRAEAVGWCSYSVILALRESGAPDEFIVDRLAEIHAGCVESLDAFLAWKEEQLKLQGK